MSDQTQGQGIDENGADAYATMQRMSPSPTPSTLPADNSGAAPVMAIQTDDNSGVPNIPAPNMGAPQPDAVEGINQEGQNQVAQSAGLVGAAPGGAQGETNPVKRIASMVMGDDAAPPQVIQQTAQGVDPQNTQPPGNRNLMALDAAYEKGGPQAAWPLLQANRVAFNAKQAFAYTALNGIAQKPADINAAVDAANQAEQHVLDGSNVKFAHSDRGMITATVTMAGTGQHQTIPLTVDQFKQYLNVGGDGQWDKLMNNTVPATLQKIASSKKSTALASQPTPQAKPGQTAAPAGETGGEEDEDTASQGAAPPKQATARDVTQGDQPALPAGTTAPKSWADQQSEADQQGYGKELERRSRQIYPDVGHEAERQQWMAAQEEKELVRQNAIDVAAEKGKNENERARIMGGARVQAADIYGQHREGVAQIGADARKYVGDEVAEGRRQAAIAELQKRASIDRNAQQRNAAAVLGHQLQNLPLMSAEEQKQVTARADAFFAAGNPGAAPQAPSGQAAAPPTGQAARPPGVPPGAKQFQGKWYTRGPNGESVPVQ